MKRPLILLIGPTAVGKTELSIHQAGDQRDYVLSPGQTMTVTKRGKVLVEAMRDADFHVA